MPEAFAFHSPHLSVLLNNNNLLLLLMLPDERKVMSSPVSIPAEQAFSELHYAESRETGKC